MDPKYRNAVVACLDCARVCMECSSLVHSKLSNPNQGQESDSEPQCCMSCHCCADLCLLTAKFLTLGYEDLANICATMCDSCSQDCDECMNDCEHHQTHCQACIDSCRTCSLELRKL